MTSSSRTITKKLSVIPIHLICEDKDFIDRLVKILLPPDANKHKRKKIRRKARNIAKLMGEALVSCISEQNVKPFESFLQNFLTFTKEQRYQIFQECHRHLNSTEVDFSEKFQTSWQLWGIRWVSEGGLLVTLNKQLNQAIKVNETNSQAYSLQDSCKAATQWIISLDFEAILLFGTIIGGALLVPVANATPTLASDNCAKDESPLTYSWQRQCPSHVSLSQTMSSSNANFLYKNYLVHSNYPLEYVKIFAFGLTHAAPWDTNIPHWNANQARIAADISAVASQLDCVYQEGRSLHDQSICQIDPRHLLANGMSAFQSPSLLWCSGWETNMTLLNKVVDTAVLLHKTVNTLVETENKAQEELTNLQTEIKTTATEIEILHSSTSSFDNILIRLRLKEDPTLKLQEKSNILLVQQKNLLENRIKVQAKLIEDMATLQQVQPVLDEKITIHARNKGIIEVTNAVSCGIDEFIPFRTQDQRKFITAGSRHFFSTTNSMHTFSPEENIAELRQHFENVEAKGQPVALLCSLHDEAASQLIRNNN
ncbi:MAG: hypothetical protein ABI370_06500 [Gammaproteobacteria bacterium]